MPTIKAIFSEFMGKANTSGTEKPTQSWLFSHLKIIVTQLSMPENDFTKYTENEWICILAAYQVRNLQMDTYTFECISLSI